MISSTGQGDVTHPVVVLLVDVVKCRALLGRKEAKHIEMMTNSTTKNIEVFKVQI